MHFASKSVRSNFLVRVVTGESNVRWIDPAEEESLFDMVVTTKDLAERQRLLSLHCGTDVELRKRIESLLFAYETSEYLETQPSEIANFRNVGKSLEGT